VRTDSGGRLEWEAIGSLPDLFGPIEAPPPPVETIETPAEPGHGKEQAPPVEIAAEPAEVRNPVPEYAGDYAEPIPADPLEALAARVAKLEALLVRGNDEAPAVEKVSDSNLNEITGNSGHLPPYPNARHLAGPFSFGASNAVVNRDMRAKRERIVRRYLAMRERRALDVAALEAGNEYCRKLQARAEDAEFRLSDLRGRVEKAEARAIAAEAMAAPALDKAQARIVALEMEVARLRPPVTMSGVAVHAMLYGKRGNLPAVANA
jgi:hypothetical protein